MAKPTFKAVKKAPLSDAAKRIYLRQHDVRSASLDEALHLPQAVLDHYAGKPTAPLHVAKALNVDPKGSQLKVFSGAAIAFGLIDGGDVPQSGPRVDGICLVSCWKQGTGRYLIALIDSI